MDNHVSKSRLLRRKLLIALVSCLIAVIGICTAVYSRIYQQASVNVNLYSSALSDETISSVSDAYYQQFEYAQERYLMDFGYLMEEKLSRDDLDFETDADLRNFVSAIAKDFFAEKVLSDVFFLYDGETISGYHLVGEHDPETAMQKAAAVFDSQIEKNSESFYQQTNFHDFLQLTMGEEYAIYEMQGEGTIIAWDNLRNYAGPDICFGLLMCDVNGWMVPVRETANEQTDELLSSMDSMFRKYIYMMAGAILCVLLVFLAVSAVLSKKLAAPVVSEHDMLVQINEMKTTFLSDVSHELKTPLAAMSGYAQNAEMELMQNGEITSVQEKLRRIFSEANRMALMVTQILDATRIEEGRMVLEKTPCDLDALVRQTVETYFAVLNKNNNRLILRIPVDLPEVSADTSRLQRVFVNLISNALKHTKNGRIMIKAEADAAAVTVTVKDTGSGISPEDLPHIWERYYKGKHSETGTGLGLFICKFIIESHGGTIGVESEPGKGTAFYFTLPLTPSEKPADTGENPIERMLRKT